MARAPCKTWSPSSVATGTTLTLAADRMPPTGPRGVSDIPLQQHLLMPKYPSIHTLRRRLCSSRALALCALSFQSTSCAWPSPPPAPRVASLLAQVILPVDDGWGGTADISGGEYARLEIETVGAG
eukprot:1342757-Pleurochrysis_carterae.AAC.12